MAATVADQYPSHSDEAIATGFADDGPVVVDEVVGRAELASQFSPLVAQQIPGLRRYAVALTRDRDRADDLVQDCLVRALTKRHLWQPETDLRAWLFTILHNSRVSELRRLAREKSRNEIAAGWFSQMPRHPDGRMELLDLDRGTGQSPERQRQALLLVWGSAARRLVFWAYPSAPPLENRSCPRVAAGAIRPSACTAAARRGQIGFADRPSDHTRRCGVQRAPSVR
jgi:DNA-directed RNA polymerase specialized sigma24 family protein